MINDKTKNLRILILRFSSIGDIVLTTPVVRCLKTQLGAQIHYVTKQQYQSIVANNPYIDKVFCLDKKLAPLLYALKAEEYDYIIDLHNNLRTWRIKRALSAKSYAFDKINAQKWLIVNLKINRLPKIHIVDRYLETLRHLGVENDGKGLDYFIPAKDEVELSSFFQQYEFNAMQKPFITFVIGATHATKRLPTTKITAICQQIQAPVVLLGGPAEAETGKMIAEKAGKHVLNLCGETNLHQSASLVRQAQQVITHDTGLMHIAAAFQKPIISLWGNTIPEFGMYPFYKKGVDKNTTIQMEGLSCRPCSKIGYDHCPKGHFNCMNQIEEASVLKNVKL